MTEHNQTDHFTRDQLLKLLSKSEIARVSNTQALTQLRNGDEYVDLKHLDQGVCLASGATIAMGQLLTKRSVQEETWTKILTLLAAVRTANSQLPI